MNTLIRNQTTAEQAKILEDAQEHPLKPGVVHSTAYFQLLAERRKLPVSAVRQAFLDVYHRNKVRLYTRHKSYREC